MLEDVINELNLSDGMIDQHGPLGTTPATLVRLILERKDREILMLKAGMVPIGDVSALTRARAEGMEDSAKIAESKAQGIREANTWRGKVNQYADQAACWLEETAAAIRAQRGDSEG